VFSSFELASSELDKDKFFLSSGVFSSIKSDSLLIVLIFSPLSRVSYLVLNPSLNYSLLTY
jgi:hypothetical protein